MSNVVHIHAEETIVDQAILWITRIDRELSEDEKKAFAKWLSTSDKHQKIFIQYAKLWDKMDSLAMLSELFPKPESAQSSKHRNTQKYGMAASVAAVMMLVAGLWQGDVIEQWLNPSATVIVQQEFQTGYGENATFYMQDKTKVVLNTNSKVTVTYTDKQRLFELERGELFVDVAHNADWPLSVHAGEQRIQAVGTAFNVELNKKHVELIVTEGKVRVAELNDDIQNPLIIDNIRLPNTSLAVSKGERVELNTIAQNQAVVQLTENDLAANLSWQSGDLIFRGETLLDALAEVSRYTPYEFEFSDDQVKQVKIAGLFKTNDLPTFLSALEQNLNVRHKRTRQNTILLSLQTVQQ